jgi:hypothetical protein
MPMPKKQNAANPTVWLIVLLVALVVPLVAVLVVPSVVGLSMRFGAVIGGAVGVFFLGMGLASLLDKTTLPRVLGGPHHPAYNLVKYTLMFAYPAVLAALWYFLASAVSGVTVHIDNATSQGYVVSVDGKQLATVAQGTTRWDSWRYGTHDVSVADGTGQVRDTFQVTIDKEGPWVLNLFGAGKYMRGSVTYGTATGGEPDRPIADRWFIADVYYLFETPPQTISIKGSGTTRTFLARGFAVQQAVK